MFSWAQQVFWIRSSDLQILTAGLHTFTSDMRLKSQFPNGDYNDWGLIIQNVKFEDSGQYECQINTEPKMKRYVHLVVRGKYFINEKFEILINQSNCKNLRQSKNSTKIRLQTKAQFEKEQLNNLCAILQNSIKLYEKPAKFRILQHFRE